MLDADSDDALKQRHRVLGHQLLERHQEAGLEGYATADRRVAGGGGSTGSAEAGGWERTDWESGTI